MDVVGVGLVKVCKALINLEWGTLCPLWMPMSEAFSVLFIVYNKTLLHKSYE